jgi:hypothetical protein
MPYGHSRSSLPSEHYHILNIPPAIRQARHGAIMDLAGLLTVTDYENLAQDIDLEYLGHAEDQERGFPRFA